MTPGPYLFTQTRMIPHDRSVPTSSITLRPRNRQVHNPQPPTPNPRISHTTWMLASIQFFCYICYADCADRAGASMHPTRQQETQLIQLRLDREPQPL